MTRRHTSAGAGRVWKRGSAKGAKRATLRKELPDGHLGHHTARATNLQATVKIHTVAPVRRSEMSRPPASLALAVVAICFGLHAGAQSTRRELVGRIRDSTGAPVMEASIEVAGLMTRSDSDGRFRLSTPAIDTLRLSVRRMGFAPELV